MESDTGLIVKGLIVFMVVALFVSLIAQQPPPGTPAPPPNSSFDNVQRQFDNGMPSFSDPFAPQTFNAEMFVATTQPCPGWDTHSDCTNGISPDGPAAAHGTAGGCTFLTWWLCATTNDNASSYFVTDANLMPATDLNFTGTVQGADRIVVVAMTLTLVCRSDNAAVPGVRIALSVDPTMITVSQIFSGFICPSNPGGASASGITFVNSTIDLCAKPIGSGSFCTYYSLLDLDRMVGRILVSSGAVDITYAKVDYSYYYAPVDCSTVPTGAFGLDQIGCYIGQGFTWLIKAGQWLINGAVFVGSLVIWGGGLLVSIGGAFVGSLVWISNLPGTPPVISGLTIAVVALPVLVGVIIAVVHIIRGNPGGV